MNSKSRTLYFLVSCFMLLAPLSTRAAQLNKPVYISNLQSGLAGWWTFDGPNMVPNIVDSSGNGNNGNLVGATTTVSGKIGQALSFNGTNNYIGSSGGTVTAPTFISYTAVPWTTITTSANSSSISWQTGDVIVVIQGNGGYNSTKIPGVPTATGLTFSSQQLISPVNNTSPSAARVSTAVAASSGSGVISLTQPGAGSSNAWGAGIWVFRGSAGVGNSVKQSTATKTVALTPTAADSAIVWGVFDYAAGTVQTISPTPTHNQGAAVVSGDFTYYVADLDDQTSSGSVSYGISGSGSGPFSNVAVEVKGSAVANGLSISGVKTISFWAKPNSTTQSIIDLDGSKNIALASGAIATNNFSGTVYVDGVATTAFPDTNWHYVTIIVSAGVDATALVMGKVASNYYGGALDDVRFYTRVLSASEITQLYTLGVGGKMGVSLAGPANLSSGLVGYWTFDGKNMTPNVIDSSGNGNNGNWIAGPTAIAHVSGQNKGEVGTTALSNLAFAGSLTTGNTIIIIVEAYANGSSNPTISTPTLVAGSGATLGTITLDKTSSGNSGSNRFTTSIYHAYVSNGGTATIGMSGTNWSNSIGIIDEYSGMDPSSPVYGTPVATTGTSNTENPGAIVTPAGGMSIMASDEISTGNFTYTQSDNNIYNLGTGASTMTGQAEYKLTASAGSQTMTANPGANSWFWTAVGAAYQPSTATTTVAGKIGQALKLSGTSNYVNAGSSSTLQPASAVSVCAWVTRSGTLSTSFPAIFTSPENTTTSGYLLSAYSTANKIMFGVVTGSTWEEAVSNSTIALNTWTDVCGTWNGTTVILYINGVAQTTTASAASINYVGSITTPAYIGNYSSNYWTGNLDDVRVYNRALSATEVQQLYTLGASTKQDLSTVQPTGLTSGLVGWWTFDGPNMVPNVLDSSGNGNNGNLFAATSTVAGKLGQALSFNGVDSASGSYVSIPSSSSLQNFSAMSICGWVKMNAYDTVDGSVIVGKFTNATAGSTLTDPWTTWALYVNSTDQLGFRLSTGSAGTMTTVDDARLVPLHIWTYACGTWDGSTMRTYINGVLGVNTTAYTSTVGTVGNPVRIGAIMSSNYWDVMNGSIDDVRVYNRALSSSEVAQLYTMGK